LHPKLRQMQAVQLLLITKACRPIRSYRLISIHFASQVTPDAGSAAAADNKSLPSDSIV